jgi:hypothetical protein
MPYTIDLSKRNISKLNAQDKAQLLADVLDEFSYSESILSDWKARIIKYYDLYQLVQKKKNYEGLANIFVPEILRAVETITAKIYQMIFAQPDWMEYVGRDEQEDDEGPAIALTQLTMYQVEENNFKARVMDAIRQMVIAGLTVRKIGWDYQTVSRKLGKNSEGKMQTQEDTIKDTWTFEAVDLLSFHISDISVPYNDFQKAKWIGEEYAAPQHWLREKIRRGYLCDYDLDKLDNDTEKSATRTQAQDLKDARFQSSGFKFQTKKDQTHIFERWGLLPAKYVLSPEEMADERYEDDDLVESVIIIGNKKAILKLERNPWYHQQKPYVACPYIPKEFELPGIGAAQIGESLQEEINDTRNQTMDNKTLILACMWLKSRGAQISDKDLVIRPNGVIKTNDMNGLEPLRPPVVTGVGTNMEGVAKNDLRESAGAASNLQGIAQAGVGTATESVTINRESVGRLVMVAQLFCELVLKPTFKMAEFLNYQFYDHVKLISVIGPVGAKYKQLKPEEIKGGLKDISIKISMDATENPAVQRQQFMNFLTIMQPMPPQAIAFHWKLLNKIFGMFFNGHDLSELYPSPAPDMDKLLAPDEERDVVLAKKPVVAKDGQDHKAYIQYHEKEMASMAHSLDEIQFELYKKLIMSHWQLLQKEIAQQQQMLMQQQMAMAQQGPGGVNKGQTPNTTPFNQSAAPTTKSLAQGMGNY